MTINGPAAIILLLLRRGRREAGRARRDKLRRARSRTTSSRSTWRSTPGSIRSSRRSRSSSTCSSGPPTHTPQWNTISISGYHIREAGATAAQELAFTLANGFTYVERGLARGLDVDDFAPRLSFFWDVHNDFFEEIAKLRAARRIWARHLRERYGARKPRSWKMRFHCQTAGVTLTAQQPMNNVVRVAYQALAAVLGGTQSLHTNALDETLALPTEESVQVALRTQQILAYETGVANVADPLGGSYYVESADRQLEREAEALFARDRGAGRRGARDRDGLVPAQDRAIGGAAAVGARAAPEGAGGRERVRDRRAGAHHPAAQNRRRYGDRPACASRHASRHARRGALHGGAVGAARCRADVDQSRPAASSRRPGRMRRCSRSGPPWKRSSAPIANRCSSSRLVARLGGPSLR